MVTVILHGKLLPGHLLCCTTRKPPLIGHDHTDDLDTELSSNIWNLGYPAHGKACMSVKL